MNARFSLVCSLALFIVAPGCGSAGVSNPPEDPAPVAMTNPEKPAPDSSPLSSAPDAPKPGANPQQSSTTELAALKADGVSATDVLDAHLAAKDKATDKPVAVATPSDVPDANISIGRLEADGLVTKDIQCKSDGGGGFGLLGMVLVTAWMSPQKKALDACAPRGQELETRVVWKAKGGKLTELEVKGDAKLKACVDKALRPGKPVFEGFCAATVVHGKK